MNAENLMLFGDIEKIFFDMEVQNWEAQRKAVDNYNRSQYQDLCRQWEGIRAARVAVLNALIVRLGGQSNG